MRDWTGNKNSIFKPLAASSHADDDRQEDDYYATDPKAMRLLLQHEMFNNRVWECACGEGHLSRVLEDAGYSVRSTDLVHRGFGVGGVDFLSLQARRLHELSGILVRRVGDDVAVPRLAGLGVVRPGGKVAMFLKLQFMEGQARKSLFLNSPPRTIYVSSSRLVCAKNGEFDKTNGSAVAYAWYVWEKGFAGTTGVKWIN